MMYQIAYYIHLDFITQFVTGPEFLFKYPLFEYLPILPESLLYFLLYTLFFAALFITLGRLYRPSIILFTIGFTYFSFIDKTLFNNHNYLIALISFVLIFIDACKSLVPLKVMRKSLRIYQWNLIILQFLIILVYFYGGITKLNADWLGGHITTTVLDQMKDSPISSLIPQSLLALLITYGSVIFDLTIGFFLLWKPSRYYAITLAVLFHFINATTLFNDIGIFPYLMIGATIILFAHEKISTLLKFKNNQPKTKKKNVKKAIVNRIIDQEMNLTSWTRKKKITAYCLFVFFLFHLIFPLRYLLFTDNPEWTGHGSRFAWRMKAQTKKVDQLQLDLYDGAHVANSTQIDIASFLSNNQLKHIINDPFLIVQFAKYIEKKAIEKGRATDPVIKVKCKVSFNGRPSQYMIDPTVDLTEVSESSWADYKWIFPLAPRPKSN